MTSLDVANVLGLRCGSGTDVGMVDSPAAQPGLSHSGAPPPAGNSGGDLPLPESPSHSGRGSYHGRKSRLRMRRPERTAKESRLKLSNRDKYQGKATVDFDVWWMCMESYIANQPHLFTKTGLKLQYC
jgi:hypothetical protein